MRTKTSSIILTALSTIGFCGIIIVNASTLETYNQKNSSFILPERKKLKGKDIMNFDPYSDGLGNTELNYKNGLTPKVYGLCYGSGGKKYSNRLRLSHNAKLKRRINK